MCLGVLLLLRGELAAHAVAGARRRLEEVLPLLADAVRLLAPGVEVVEQLGKALRRLLLHGALVLKDRPIGEVRGLSVPAQEHREEILRADGTLPRGKALPERIFVPTAARIRRPAGAVDQLARDERRDGRVGIEQPPVERLLRRGLRKQLQKLLPLRRQRRALVLRGRQVVKQSRQHLPLLRHLKIDAAQTVDDVSVRRAENQVRPPPHRFENQAEAALLAELVECLDLQLHHALELCLTQRRDAPAGEILAQQHAEHGRLAGVVAQQARQVQSRLTHPGAYKQPP